MLDVDPLIRWAPICKALGDCSRRTLYDMVQRKDFPAPDVPASKRGEPDLWRKSTAERGIEEFARLRVARSGDSASDTNEKSEPSPTRRQSPQTRRAR